MNKNFHANNIILQTILPLLVVVSLCGGLFGITSYFGNRFCARQAEYVGLQYSYLDHWETGSSCSLYYNGRWISSSTYYEWNDISFSELRK